MIITKYIVRNNNYESVYSNTDKQKAINYAKNCPFLHVYHDTTNERPYIVTE